jgi:hypothetical protein
MTELRRGVELLFYYSLHNAGCEGEAYNQAFVYELAALIKKKIKFFLIYREIHSGAVINEEGLSNI